MIGRYKFYVILYLVGFSSGITLPNVTNFPNYWKYQAKYTTVEGNSRSQPTLKNGGWRFPGTWCRESRWWVLWLSVVKFRFSNGSPNTSCRMALGRTTPSLPPDARPLMACQRLENHFLTKKVSFFQPLKKYSKLRIVEFAGAMLVLGASIILSSLLLLARLYVHVRAVICIHLQSFCTLCSANFHWCPIWMWSIFKQLLWEVLFN